MPGWPGLLGEAWTGLCILDLHGFRHKVCFPYFMVLMCSAKLVLRVRRKGNARVPLKKTNKWETSQISPGLGGKERDKAM